MSLESHSSPEDFIPIRTSAYLNYGLAADLVLDAHSVLWSSEDKAINPDYALQYNMLKYNISQSSKIFNRQDILQAELAIQASVLAGQKNTDDEEMADIRERFVAAKLIVSSKPADSINVRAKSTAETKKNLKALKIVKVVREAFAAWHYDQLDALPAHQSGTPGQAGAHRFE